MIHFIDLFRSRGDFWSWAFVIWWGSLLIFCVGQWAFEKKDVLTYKKLEAFVFWCYGCSMVAFAAFRPIGIARDDLPYLEIFQRICPTVSCGIIIQGSRDWGWFSLVGILKSFYPDPSVMLWLAAAGLLIKLFVIYSLARRSIPVLLMYSAIFYELQDLTAWRVSLSISLFMLSIWAVAKFRTYSFSYTFLICGLFHKQAFVAPLSLVGIALRRYKISSAAFCAFLITMLVFGLYPQLNDILFHMGETVQKMFVKEGLDSYISAKESGLYIGWRAAPLVVYPQILLILWLLIKINIDNEHLEALVVGSFVAACAFLWGFASLPDPQVRLFEFFMTPTIFFVGARRLSILEQAGLLFASGVYVCKYNVLHHLLV